MFSIPGMLLFVSLLILAVSRAQPAATHLLRTVIFGLGLLALFGGVLRKLLPSAK